MVTRSTVTLQLFDEDRHPVDIDIEEVKKKLAVDRFSGLDFLEKKFVVFVDRVSPWELSTNIVAETCCNEDGEVDLLLVKDLYRSVSFLCDINYFGFGTEHAMLIKEPRGYLEFKLGIKRDYPRIVF